jgi:hypothetical protein
MLKADNDLAQQKGVSIENAMSNASRPVGSNHGSSSSMVLIIKWIAVRPRQNTRLRLKIIPVRKTIRTKWPRPFYETGKGVMVFRKQHT